MLTTSTAAVAAVLADYLRCRQLAALAHANYRAIDAQLATAAATALAVGAITWAEYQQAMQV